MAIREHKVVAVHNDLVQRQAFHHCMFEHHLCIHRTDVYWIQTHSIASSYVMILEQFNQAFQL